MKTLKILPLVLAFWILFISWCEKGNTEWQYACETDETCPIEWLTNNKKNTKEVVEGQPLMRKMIVNEDATPEEIESEMTETCSNNGWTWSEWKCTLEDGTVIMF